MGRWEEGKRVDRRGSLPMGSLLRLAGLSDWPKYAADDGCYWVRMGREKARGLPQRERGACLAESEHDTSLGLSIFYPTPPMDDVGNPAGFFLNLPYG